MQCFISEYEDPQLVVYKFFLSFIALYQDDELHSVDDPKWCVFPVHLYHIF